MSQNYTFCHITISCHQILFHFRNDIERLSVWHVRLFDTSQIMARPESTQPQDSPTSGQSADFWNGHRSLDASIRWKPQDISWFWTRQRELEYISELVNNSSLSNIHPEPLRVSFLHVLSKVKIVQCQTRTGRELVSVRNSPTQSEISQICWVLVPIVPTSPIVLVLYDLVFSYRRPDWDLLAIYRKWPTGSSPEALKNNRTICSWVLNNISYLGTC